MVGLVDLKWFHIQFRGDHEVVSGILHIPFFEKKINSKMRIYGIIRNSPAVMLTWLYLPEWQKIL